MDNRQKMRIGYRVNQTLGNRARDAAKAIAADIPIANSKMKTE
jgi:hypothetical protein